MDEAQISYEFDSFRVDPARRMLFRDSEAVAITPKAFDTLMVLIENRGRVVSKDELIGKVWPDTVVEENNLTQNISALRKAMGEKKSDHRFIVTVPGRGYQFVAEVRGFSGNSTPALSVFGQDSSESDLRQKTDEPAAVSASHEIEPAKSNPEFPCTPTNPRFHFGKRTAAMAMILSTVMIAVSVLGFVWLRTKKSPSQSFEAMTVTRFTDASSARVAAVSPDGKYIAYAVSEGGRQSLWVRQVAAASSGINIAAPSQADYRGITFSPDGDFVYYTTRELDETAPALHAVPALGGGAKKILDDVWSAVSFSPDGSQFAFVRESAAGGESLLVAARIDGGVERVLASRRNPDGIKSPAWSPDGESIAFSDGNADSGLPNIDAVAVRLNDGTEQRLTSYKWKWIGAVRWVPDGTGLLIVGRDQSARPVQIWHIGYPDKTVRKITNDANSYTGLSVSSDGNVCVTVEAAPLTNIWLVPQGQAYQAKQMGWGVTWYPGVSWSPDSRLVYASKTGPGYGLTVLDPASGAQRRLIDDSPLNTAPSTSSDGRTIVFVSDRSGTFNLWRIDIDGSNLRQLTFGSGEHFPSCSPNGKWVAYTSINTDETNVWMVSMEGGEPFLVTAHRSTRPSFSPDGKYLTCLYWKTSEGPASVGVISLSDPRNVKTLPFPRTAYDGAGVRWSPDGRSIMYIDTKDGISNVWALPLDGEPARQVTHFTDDRMFSFDWSRDGNHLACVRGVWTHNVVMVTLR